MISLTAEYALRAVVHLAAGEGDNPSQTVGQIAAATRVPAALRRSPSHGLIQPASANSAVQITSMPSTSHSSDSASRRWTSCLRCSSADSGSSTRLTVTSGFSAEKAAMASL